MSSPTSRGVIACFSIVLLSATACSESELAPSDGDGGTGATGGAGAAGGSVASASGGSTGTDCDATPPYEPPFPETLTLQPAFGDPDEMEVRTQGIWAIWWYPQFDHEQDVEWMFAQLNDVRCRSLQDLAMQDPPNPGNGVYYNVYIHHGEDDAFPTEWANGQGTDSFGNPYLSLPNGAHLEAANVNHEGFHVFQYSADSPGFAYAGDSQWYIETTAQWYTAFREPTLVDTFVEAGAIDGNPQLALWHSFSNEAPGDPTDWLFQVRQYGMHTYLFYLTEFAGVNRDIITSGFYNAVRESPQQYLYDGIGGDTLRGYFADWAAHNTADFDYLLPEQVQRARAEVVAVGDPDNLNPYVAEYTDAGTAGEWVPPPTALTPRSWAYNVVRIANTQAASYEFSLRGQATGSSGAAAHLEGRVVVLQPSGAQYSALTMDDALNGSATVSVNTTDSDVYLVIASVPESFSGNQTFGYEYRIERQ